MTCEDCLLEWEECVCGQVDKFFSENRGLWNHLADDPLPPKKRCLGCFNYRCSCQTGHMKRLKK